MLDRRSPLILGALPVGLATGALVWLLVGGNGLATSDLALIEAKLANTAPAASAHHELSVGLVNDALSAPLFALTTGPGAVADAVLRLDGVAKTPRHSAALISIGGKPAEWLQLGETRDDVTLQEVQGASVVVDTATGFKTIALGDATQPPPQSSAADRSQGAPPTPSRSPLPAVPTTPPPG